jgi:hypothetical protein
MAYAIRGIFVDDNLTHPPDLAPWLIGSAVAHDLVVAPLALAAGWTVNRWVPGPIRGPVQLGLFASAVMMLFAYPLVRGYGAIPSNPSALPRDYTTGLLMVLGVIWAAVTASVATTAIRQKVRARAPR